MNCKKCKKLIHLYLDGEISPQERDFMFSHIDRCSDCADYYEDMAALCDRLFEEDREEPLAFSEGWRSDVRARAAKKKGFNFKVMIPALAACVCGVFVISIAVLNPEAFGGGLANLASQNASMEQGVALNEEAGQPEAAPAEAEATVVPVPEAAPTEAALEEDGMLDETTVQGGGSSTTSSGSMSDAQVTSSASAKPAAAPAAKAGTFSMQGSAGDEIDTRDATRQKLKTRITEFAAQQAGIAVTDAPDGLILEGDTAILNQILAEFNLEQLTDQTVIKILCEA